MKQKTIKTLAITAMVGCVVYYIARGMKDNIRDQLSNQFRGDLQGYIRNIVGPKVVPR